MIRGIGVDFVDRERFKNIKEKEEFLKEILTNKEILNIPKKYQKTFFSTKIFTIKEAIFKAFRCGLYYGSYWHNITIGTNYKVRLSGFIKNLAHKKRVSKVHMTQSHSKNYVMSFVLLEE